MLPNFVRLCYKGAILFRFYTCVIRYVNLIIIDSIILLKAIKAATDLDSEDPHLSGLSVITLEGSVSCLY